MPETDLPYFKLISTVKELRGENGCPWDRRQTADTLVKYLHSEFAELIEAIEGGNPQDICEEAGDMLFLLVMLSEIHNEAGQFSINDVIQSITDKLIRRHPHVFAGQTYENEEQLKEQWEAIKAAEKSRKTN